MVLVVEILTVSVSMANELFCLTIVVEILALLVGRKSQPLESCMLMFIEVMSIDCDSLSSPLSSVSFPLWASFKGGILPSCCCEKMNCKIVALYGEKGPKLNPCHLRYSYLSFLGASAIV